LKITSSQLKQKEQTLNKLQESIGRKMMEEQRWRKNIDEHVEEINQLKEEVARLNDENDQLDADIQIGLEAEDEMRIKISELENKLTQTIEEKDELEKKIEDHHELYKVFELPDNNADVVEDIEKVRQEIIMEHKSFLRRIFPDLVSKDEEREYFENPALNSEWLRKLEAKIKLHRTEN